MDWPRVRWRADAARNQSDRASERRRLRWGSAGRALLEDELVRPRAVNARSETPRVFRYLAWKVDRDRNDRLVPDLTDEAGMLLAFVVPRAGHIGRHRHAQDDERGE